jgi:cyclopropane fatty-acyl-phospholipid synthase-like methyltransferase
VAYDVWVLRCPGFLLVAAALAGLPARQTRAPDVYFAASRQAVADAMLALARVTPDDVVFDLGSGDGRIVILAAQKYGARGVGVEIDAGLVARARDLARDGGVADRVTFVHGDMFTTDISAADVVTLYLSATTNADLEPKLKRELRPGARIVSQQFPMPGWPPLQTARAAGQELFLWVVR